jgi:hypothetical protein
MPSLIQKTCFARVDKKVSQSLETIGRKREWDRP